MKLHLAYGDTQQRWLSSDVFFYEREFGGDVVLVGINRSLDSYDIDGLYTALPRGSYADELDGILDGFSTTVNSDGSIDTFSFGPKTVCIWQHRGDTVGPSIGHVGPTMAHTDHTITVHGSGFGSSQGTVEFDSTSAGIVSWSDTEVEVDVPYIAGGFYDITVTDANGATSGPFTGFELLSDDLVSARFVVHSAETESGENVYLLGDQHEIGSWNESRAVGRFFNQVVYDYPTWYYDVAVPENRDIEFKFVKIDGSGNAVYESGDNRTYTTPVVGETGFYEGTWK